MTWGVLLESVHDLQRMGMSVPVALEHHARSGEGETRALARRWLVLRTRYGDPARAMRGLASQAHRPRDRFVLEVLVVCLERPAAAHDRTLKAATDQLRLERAVSSRLRASRTQPLALVLAALYAGDDVAQAIARTETAFGSRRVNALSARLERARGGAVPAVQIVLDALSEERSRQRLSPPVLPRTAAVGFALTLAAAGVFVPGSTGLTLAGW